jgi:putative transposase
MQGFKTQLILNNKQTTLMKQHCGVSRHAWNWGLALCQERLKNKEKLPSAIDLHKLLVSDVKPHNQWYYDVSKNSPQQALANLITAYKNYFRNVKSGIVSKKQAIYVQKCKSKSRVIDYDFLKEIGKPNFKKKGGKDSFYTERYDKDKISGQNVGGIKINDNYIFLPKIGKVKLSERFDELTVKNCVVSRVSDKWFVSFKLDVPNLKVKDIELKDTVGVDLGIKTLAVLSNGKVFDNKRPFKRNKRKLKLTQRKQSKLFKKSNKEQSKNYKKQSLKVSKIHYKISCIRKDAIHKLTTYLSKNHREIVIEDLNVSGMSKNHKLASAILDGGFFEFRRQLEYKTKWYGSVLTVCNRYYPSSKTCSNCGTIKKDLKLSDRVYKCQNCKIEIDRDLNASFNLNKLSVSYTALMPVDGFKNSFVSTDEAQMKQEENVNFGINVQDCISFS